MTSLFQKVLKLYARHTTADELKSNDENKSDNEESEECSVSSQELF